MVVTACPGFRRLAEGFGDQSERTCSVLMVSRRRVVLHLNAVRLGRYRQWVGFRQGVQISTQRVPHRGYYDASKPSLSRPVRDLSCNVSRPTPADLGVAV